MKTLSIEPTNFFVPFFETALHGLISLRTIQARLCTPIHLFSSDLACATIDLTAAVQHDPEVVTAADGIRSYLETSRSLGAEPWNSKDAYEGVPLQLCHGAYRYRRSSISKS